MNKHISNKISFISLIIVLGITIYHSNLLYAVPFYIMLSMVYMPWFFMISGYFAAKGFDKTTRWKRLYKRIFTLIIPYVLWNLIHLPFGYIMSGFSYTSFNLKKYLLGFFFSPGCIPTWYLFAVFVMVVFFFLIKPLFMGKKKMGILLGLSFVLTFALFAWFPNTLVRINYAGGFLYKTVQYLPSFMFGAFAAELKDEAIQVKSKKWILFAILAAADLALICIVPPETEGMKFAGLILTGLAFGVNIFNPLLWLAIPEDIFNGGKIAQIITEPSLFLCMSHIMLIEVWTKIFGFPDRMRYQLIIVPSAIITSVALFYIMKKFTPHVLNLLTGGRAVKKEKEK